jgi:hypothetical protein
MYPGIGVCEDQLEEVMEEAEAASNNALRARC